MVAGALCGCWRPLQSVAIRDALTRAAVPQTHVCRRSPVRTTRRACHGMPAGPRRQGPSTRPRPRRRAPCAWTASTHVSLVLVTRSLILSVGTVRVRRLREVGRTTARLGNRCRVAPPPVAWRRPRSDRRRGTLLNAKGQLDPAASVSWPRRWTGSRYSWCVAALPLLPPTPTLPHTHMWECGGRPPNSFLERHPLPSLA